MLPTLDPIDLPIFPPASGGNPNPAAIAFPAFSPTSAVVPKPKNLPKSPKKAKLSS